MSVLLQFAMFPTDKGESVSQYVSKIIEMIDKSGASYKLTPMATIIETETLSEALDFINKSYDVLEPYTNRVYATVTLDIRKGRISGMQQKIESVEKFIGKVKE